MYQNSCECRNGLGFITELVGAASGLLTGDSSGASPTGTAPSGGAATSSPTVSPVITTQISPQISPIFQQQFQPSNSAATAGTAQSLPGISSGAGSPVGDTIGIPGYANPPVSAPLVPSVPQMGTDWGKYAPYALGAVALIVAAKIFTKKRGA